MLLTDILQRLCTSTQGYFEINGLPFKKEIFSSLITLEIISSFEFGKGLVSIMPNLCTVTERPPKETASAVKTQLEIIDALSSVVVGGEKLTK